MEDPAVEDSASPAVASIETYPVTTTTATSTTTTTTKAKEVESSCTFDCPSGECNWRFDWVGNPECTCKSGEYNADTKVNKQTVVRGQISLSEMRIGLFLRMRR